MGLFNKLETHILDERELYYITRIHGHKRQTGVRISPEVRRMRRFVAQMQIVKLRVLLRGSHDTPAA